MTEPTYLRLTWGRSRGRDTYGYNIARLRDESTGRTFRCMGGGYDMVGTVLADWATATHADRLAPLAGRAYYVARPGEPYRVSEDPDAFYGMARHESEDGSSRVSLDGACGVETVRRILEAAGIHTRATVSPRGRTTGFLVTVDGAR